MRALAILLLFQSVAFLHADWSPMAVPGAWDAAFTAKDRKDEIGWYRCFVPVPADWKDQTLYLCLGRIADADETFWNGTPIGGTGAFQPYQTAETHPRVYSLASAWIRPGSVNLLTVRVINRGGKGGVTHGPLYMRSAKGMIRLDGNWQFRAGDDRAWANAATTADEQLAFLKAAGPNFGEPIAAPLFADSPRLDATGDLAAQLVADANVFLGGQLERSRSEQSFPWTGCSFAKAFCVPEQSRKELFHRLGLPGGVVEKPEPAFIATPSRSSLVGKGTGYSVHAVSWRAFDDVTAEGLLLLPDGPAIADIVAIPDADQTPEQILGLAPGVAEESQFARKLAERGCRVIVPTLIDRKFGTYRGKNQITNREFLYRSAYILGKHLIGYELAKVRSAAFWLRQSRAPAEARVGVVGWGEGGMLALYAGALDVNFSAVGVSGYFDDRTEMWREPADRNVCGRLPDFRDARLAAMHEGRPLIIEAARGPELTLASTGGAPGRLTTPKIESVRAEVAFAKRLFESVESPKPSIELIESGDGTGPFGTPVFLDVFVKALAPEAKPAAASSLPTSLASDFPVSERAARQFEEIRRYNERLLAASADVRTGYFKDLDVSSLAKFEATVEPYRKKFYDDVIGRFDEPMSSAPAKIRWVYDEPKWSGYDVVLDVFPGLWAYGTLLVPKDLKAGEKRPVVVCQHGLEGRPQDCIAGDHPAYHDFAAKLAERGFVTFSPQNLYIGRDRFRVLQRMANPLGKSLFSMIVPQHQRIVDWLGEQAFVDKERIGFYGLSYGGKTAMRVPPLVKGYCLSICSGDFNEWVWKNAASTGRYTYTTTGEYEIFEFDLGGRFNYAEMAALIAPRPFMVERGHFDGVAPDDQVAFEYAKVQFLYAAKLGIADRCAIEFFPGPHTINGKGTYDFLHRHLNWPKPAATQ